MIRFLLMILILCSSILPSLVTAADDPKSKSSSPQKLDFKSLGENLKAAVEKKEMSSDQAKESYRLISFYHTLDTNGDNIIHPSEFAKHRYRADIERRIRESGMNPANPIDLNVYMAKRLKNAGLNTSQVRTVVSYYRPATQKTRPRITLDLPSEFVELDTDQDNQIGLYEWPREKRAEFKKLDVNQDGFVTPREIQFLKQSEQKRDD